MFFENLKLLCTKNNISVTALALELGLSSSKVTMWKSGSVPKGDILIKLADYFNISTDYLLGRTNISSYENQVDETIQLYLSLDEVDKAEIKGEIKQMLKQDKYNYNISHDIAAFGGEETEGTVPPIPEDTTAL